MIYYVSICIFITFITYLEFIYASRNILQTYIYIYRICRKKFWKDFLNENDTKSNESKEALALPKAAAKAKALKAKKAVLKGIHSHTQKEDPHVTHFQEA